MRVYQGQVNSRTDIPSLFDDQADTQPRWSASVFQVRASPQSLVYLCVVFLCFCPVIALHCIAFSRSKSKRRNQ